MSVEWNGDGAKAGLSLEAARVLLAMAVTVQAEYLRRTSRSNSRGKDPSRPGEYLRRYTGHTAAGVVYGPTTAAAVAREGAVRLGQTENTWWGAWWGVRPDARRRKGLRDLVEEMRPQLAAIGAKA